MTNPTLHDPTPVTPANAGVHGSNGSHAAQPASKRPID
jgi:hypothetical protein